MEKIIQYVRTWYESRQDCKKRHNETLVRKKANELFDITVHVGKQWITYNGDKVCPCEMLEEKDVAKAVEAMRCMYIANSLH